MFGADGERLLALREQQKAQYMADLQHQIEEKSRRPKSPSTYSTSMQDATSSHQFSNTYNMGAARNSYNNAHRMNNSTLSNINSNLNMNSNINQTSAIDRNLSNLQQSNRFNTINQSYDYTPTTIGMINIPINPKSTISKYQTSLPIKIESSKKVDASKFDQRIKEIANHFQIQQNTIDELFNDESTIEQNLINMQNLMLQVKSITNEKSSSEIPYKSSQIAKSFKEHKQIITSQNMTFDSEINNIREKYSNTSNSLSTFTSTFTEQLNTIKQQLTSIKTDKSRVNSNIEKTKTKLTTNEQKNDMLLEKIQKQNEDFSIFDQNLIQKFNGLNTVVSSIMTQYSQILATEIQKESRYRMIINQKLCEQVLLLRNRIQSSFTQIIDKNKELSNSFKNSIETMKNSISSIVNENESQIEQLIDDINDRIDQLITQTETEFRSISDNISLTTTESKNFTKEAFKIIEETLQLEASITKKNKDEILTKYDHFDNAMKEEMKIKKKVIESTFSELEKNEIKNFDDSLNPVKNDKSIIKATIDNLDIYESDINNLENLINNMNSKTALSINKLEENFMKIKEDLELKKTVIHKNFNEIERRLSILESNRERNDLILTGDIYLLNKKFENDQEPKIVELEKQIGVALKALADLMGGKPPSLHTTLDQLHIESVTDEETEISESKTENEEENKNKIKEEEEEEVKETKIEEEEEDNEEEEKTKVNKDHEKEEEEEEEEEEEIRKKTEPIKIHVGKVEIGNINELDKPNDIEIGKGLAFNPNDFGFTLSSQNKNNQKNNEKQKENKNEEEEFEEEEEDNEEPGQPQSYNHYDYDKVMPVC